MIIRATITVEYDLDEMIDLMTDSDQVIDRTDPDVIDPLDVIGLWWSDEDLQRMINIKDTQTEVIK